MCRDVCLCQDLLVPDLRVLAKKQHGFEIFGVLFLTFNYLQLGCFWTCCVTLLCHLRIVRKEIPSINQAEEWVGSICDSSVWKTCVSVSPARCGVENPKTRNHSKPMEKSMHRLHRCRTTVNDRFHRLNDGSNQSSLEHGSLL